MPSTITGATHEIVACLFPAIPVTFVGALKTDEIVDKDKDEIVDKEINAVWIPFAIIVCPELGIVPKTLLLAS